MANGDPVELPNLEDPQAILNRRRMARTGSEVQQQPTRRTATQSPGAMLDGIVGIYGNEPDPGMRSIMKALVETEISRAMGFNVNLPDPEDVEHNQLLAQRENMRLTREIAKETVSFAKAKMLDIPKDDPLQQMLGGADLDTLIESDPDKAIAVFQKMGFPVTRQTLSLAEIQDTDTASAAPAFQAKQAEEQVKGLQTQASGIEAATKAAKAEAGGQFQEQAKAALKASGEALGVDMDNLIDNPIDTDLGGVALADAVGTLFAQAGPAFKPMVAQGLLQAYASDFKDALEDEPSDGGLLVVGQGGKDITPRATFYATASLMRVAKEANIPMGDLFKQLDLGQFTGIEGKSFNDFMAKEAKTSGMDVEDFRAGLGI